MNDEVKSGKVQALEQSLITFLLSKRDIEEKTGTGYRRIRSISLKLNDKDPMHVTFTVSMGMVSAEFGIMSGLKERGNCFGLEKYIREWSERDIVKSELIALTSLNKGGSGVVLNTGVKNTIR
ncbi:hypothetical protein IJ843_05510 [bacterium]|nr:hypothetical protein [bacterium]